jgi:leucyl-tRNA---protein transferase
MKTLFTFQSPPGPCSYLPERESSMRYEMVAAISAAEYEARMNLGWRRFGKTLFRPSCPDCNDCIPLRVDVAKFTPSTSLRRVLRLAEPKLALEIVEPSATQEKLDLYHQFHDFQTGFKDWPERYESLASYAESFVDHPFRTEEWNYRLDGKLVAVGYVDALAASLSMMYFFYHPEVRSISPGTFNVLKGIEEAKRRGKPYLHLGYFVEGCRSLEYKGRFHPHERFDWVSGVWEKQALTPNPSPAKPGEGSMTKPSPGFAGEGGY